MPGGDYGSSRRGRPADTPGGGGPLTALYAVRDREVASSNLAFPTCPQKPLMQQGILGSRGEESPTVSPTGFQAITRHLPGRRPPHRGAGPAPGSPSSDDPCDQMVALAVAGTSASHSS